MEMHEADIARRLRIAGILIVLGLIVQLFTLDWNHPITFLVFLGVGGLFLFAGMAVYLWSLVSEKQTSADIVQDNK
jgi:hypothetical protein